VRQGWTWTEVMAMSEFDRLACYYANMCYDGMIVDWTTGEITRPAPRTLRDS
jgi:hypothetical protein